MVIEVPNLQALRESLESLFDRFTNNESIRLENIEPPKLDKKRGSLSYVIPKESVVKTVKEAWQHNRRQLPKSGIVFNDGSIMTILFQCIELPAPKLLTPVLPEILVINLEGKAICLR